MATAKRKPRRKTTTKKKKTVNTHLWSVVIFSLGLLIAMITIIPGGAVWKVMHNGIHGLFGLSAFLIAPLMLYIAILISIDKSKNMILSKTIQGVILILLFSSIVQVIFIGNVSGDNIFSKLGVLYTNGVVHKGGGILSSLVGLPLMLLFTRVGASIILVILTFTFALLLTNVSLVSIFKGIAMPFKKSAKVLSDAKEEKAIEKSKKPAKEKKKKNSKVDFAKYVDDEVKVKADTSPIANEQENLPIHPVVSNKTGTDKKGDNSDLQEIIQNAVSIVKKTENKEENKNVDEENIDKEVSIDSELDQSLSQKDIETPPYKKPPLEMLNPPVESSINEDTQIELKHNSEVLVDTLKSFGVQTRIVGINRGPSVTRYELQPAAGVKVSKITGLTDDVKMALAAKSIRIEAPIPGKAAVGIEVPNKAVDIITMKEMLESAEFEKEKSDISFALGKDITGNVVFADIAKMPHVLIAGATGSGKSVCINSIIISILYKSSPDDVRVLMIDPKMVELEVYNGIPHLLIPVVTDARKAAGALSWAVTEMQKRYKLFADYNVRNIEGFNKLAKKSDEIQHLPQIVIIIDELADLMMVAAKDVEEAICRLAQLARAAGMHLVIATQRPSVDIITGVIKANIPTRIAFSVSSQIDSRTILDSGGAEKLLGRGDMLYSAYGSPIPVRVQGCYVSDKEVENIVDFIKNEVKADYDDNIMEEIEKSTPATKNENTKSGSVDSSDEMVGKAIEIVVDAGQASTSYLQRRLKLGYARAARIMDELEEMGIIGPPAGSKPRAVLMSKEQWYEAQLSKSDQE